MPSRYPQRAHLGSTTVMGRFLAGIFLIALALGATLATWPQLADLELTAPWLQIVSMRGLGAAIALFFAMIFVLLRAGAKRRRGYLNALTFIVFAFAAANTAILFSRGLFPGELPAPKHDQIRVMAWNTLGDKVPIENLADVADRTNAEVIVMPETTSAHAKALAAMLLNDIGVDYAVHTVSFDPNYKALSTSVLVDTELGRYEISSAYGNTSVVPSVVLEPLDRGARPRIVGIHSVSPITEEMDSWRVDRDWLSEICRLPNTIVAGDANATADQLRSLDGCQLSSVQAGAAGLGTWPTTLPVLLGAPIDQVLTTAEWKASGFSVLSEEDSAGSDHRPIAAVLVSSKE